MILIDLLVGVESFYMVSTISFSCLIAIEFLNLFTEVMIWIFSCIELGSFRWRVLGYLHLSMWRLSF